MFTAKWLAFYNFSFTSWKEMRFADIIPLLYNPIFIFSYYEYISDIHELS